MPIFDQSNLIGPKSILIYFFKERHYKFFLIIKTTFFGIFSLICAWYEVVVLKIICKNVVLVECVLNSELLFS